LFEESVSHVVTLRETCAVVETEIHEETCAVVETEIHEEIATQGYMAIVMQERQELHVSSVSHLSVVSVETRELACALMHSKAWQTQRQH
jgi:hypothetical protein